MLLVQFLGGFVHLNEGGQAVGVVDVYDLQGTFVRSLQDEMPTPRGFMTTVLWNETVVVALGGSPSDSSNEGLPIVEALDLSSPEGSWMAWGNLTYSRLNATATVGLGGLIVALGASYGNPVELFFPSNQSTVLLPDISCSGSSYHQHCRIRLWTLQRYLLDTAATTLKPSYWGMEYLLMSNVLFHLRALMEFYFMQRHIGSV